MTAMARHHVDPHLPIKKCFRGILGAKAVVCFIAATGTATAIATSARLLWPSIGMITTHSTSSPSPSLSRAARPPNPCLAAQPSAPSPNKKKNFPNDNDYYYYRSIPGSLELFDQNRVVCPDQLAGADLLRRGNMLASVTPDQWGQYLQALSASSQQADKGRSSRNKSRGLIVFKRGGSGSTWFDTLLGNHPDLDFRHEAHHSVYKQNGPGPLKDPQKATEKMRSFLLHNTSNNSRSKCQSDAGYCGFSISPTKHANGVDWAELIHETGATLVVFIRTNVVKRILGIKKKSLIRKVPQKCKQGSSFKASMEDDPDCALRNKGIIEFPLEEIKKIDQACFQQSWDLLNAALETGAPFQILTYEGMQQNVTTTLEHLGSFSGWPLGSFDWSSHVTTAKVSSENLRLGISNYLQVEQALQAKPCFLDMLHSKDKQMFPLCYSPRNFTYSGV